MSSRRKGKDVFQSQGLSRLKQMVIRMNLESEL